MNQDRYQNETTENRADRLEFQQFLRELYDLGLLKSYPTDGFEASYLCDRGDSELNAEVYKKIIGCDALDDFNTHEIIAEFGDCPVWVPLSQVRRSIEVHGLRRCQYFSVQVYVSKHGGPFASIQLLGRLKDD